MTDALVEKVARAIVSAKDGDPDFIHGGAAIWTIYKDEARAAILAVAEWGQSNFYDDKPLHEFIDELLRAARDEVSRG